MSLAAKVDTLREQLGLHADLVIKDVVDQAVEQLGLSGQCKGMPLIEQVDRCLQVLGVNQQAPVVAATLMAVPVGIVPAVAAQAWPQADAAHHVSGPITFTFFIDDWVTSCFYNGVDMMSQVNRGQCQVSTVRAEYVPGAVLCIGGWDNQSGGAAGLFLGVDAPGGRFKLSSRRGSSVCKVLPMGGNTPPQGWHTVHFDDSHWQPPGSNSVWGGWQQHLPAAMRSLNLSGADGVWNGRQKYNYFRINIEAGLTQPELPPQPFGSPNCLALVDAGNPNKCFFKEADTLRAGRSAPLALGGAAFEGLAVAKRYTGERHHGEWRYIESGVATAPHALTVQYNNGFLELPNEDLVFDISFWRFDVGNTVNFVGGGQRCGGCCGKANTYLANHPSGRSWTINQDGTVSPRTRGDLFLGLWEHGGHTHHSMAGWAPPRAVQPMEMPRS